MTFTRPSLLNSSCFLFVPLELVAEFCFHFGKNLILNADWTAPGPRREISAVPARQRAHQHRYRGHAPEDRFQRVRRHTISTCWPDPGTACYCYAMLYERRGEFGARALNTREDWNRGYFHERADFHANKFAFRQK